MPTGREDYDAILRTTSIPEDEPFFLLRAQDAVGADAVRGWAAVAMAEQRGADSRAPELNALRRRVAELEGRVADLIEDDWRPMSVAPRDGLGVLAYGRHDRDAPEGASPPVRAGDHWWAIILWDVWRDNDRWVFAKDGTPTWSEPLACRPLTVPDLEALS